LTALVRVKHRIVINIAGFVVALELNNDRLATRIQERYRLFLGEDEAPHLEIAITATPDVLFVPVTGGDWVIDAQMRDDRLTFLSYRERGEIDITAGVGQLEMDPEADIENFLRVVFAWLCLQHDAVLLHAGGVRRDSDGLGYVFFGPSGAGKTTSTTLSGPQATILSDDLVVIRPSDAGGCRLHGVPFRGELVEAPRANQSAPLKAIFRLQQADQHALEPLSHTVAVAEMAAAAPFVVGSAGQHDRLIRTCSRIAQSTAVYRLSFRKDPGFWTVIDEHLANVS
jgi:hypothetical protein